MRNALPGGAPVAMIVLGAAQELSESVRAVGAATSSTSG
jgi:hypothetical protein